MTSVDQVNTAINFVMKIERSAKTKLKSRERLESDAPIKVFGLTFIGPVVTEGETFTLFLKDYGRLSVGAPSGLRFGPPIGGKIPHVLFRGKF